MREQKPLTRKLHLSSGIWSYFVGKRGVKIRTPDCFQSFHVVFGKLRGIPQYQSIRDYEMYNGDSIKIKPYEVRDYILQHLEQTYRTRNK